MLALTLALALTPHVNPYIKVVDVQTVAPKSSAAVASGAQTSTFLIPYGQALGTYTPPTWISNGSMLAVLEDAAGNPLWALDAEILATGTIDGQLHLLRYAGNPASSLVSLGVTGHALLDAQGEGPFSATLFAMSQGAIPIYPMGKLEGVLKQTPGGQGGAVLSGKSGLTAAAFAPDVQQLPTSSIAPVLSRDGGVIVCPKGPDYAIFKLQAAANKAQLSQAATQGRNGNPVIIFCPKGPDTAVAGVQSVGQLGKAGHVSLTAASTDPDPSANLGSNPGVLKPARYDAPDVFAAVSAGTHAQVGASTSIGAQGVLCLRWWLNP